MLHGVLAALAAASPSPSSSSELQAQAADDRIHVPLWTLNNGVKYPPISFGSSGMTVAELDQELTYLLAKAEFPHIDTASNYGNQPQVGSLMKARPRSEVFVTTKIETGMHDDTTVETAYAAAMENLHRDLEELNTTYIDVVLHHHPPIYHHGQAPCAIVREIWRAMEEFYQAGHARAIGVSNYCPSTFACLPADAVKPAVNQVQHHVGMTDDPGGIRSYCQSHNILLTAYSPLGTPQYGASTGPYRQDNMLNDEDLIRIGEANGGVSAAFVAQRWLYQHNVGVVTRSSTPAHVKEDLKLHTQSLSDEAMATLDAKDDHTACIQASMASGSSICGYSFVCTA